jgi:hypothetical protein
MWKEADATYFEAPSFLKHGGRGKFYIKKLTAGTVSKIWKLYPYSMENERYRKHGYIRLFLQHLLE